MSKYETNTHKPSKMFINACRGGGASSIHCNCGREHFAPGNLRNSEDEDDYESALEDAIISQKNDPEGFIVNYEDDFIYTKDIDGKTFVVDCPCNGLRKYEDWIWGNREIIRDYLKFRVEQEARWAEQELVLNKLAGI